MSAIVVSDTGPLHYLVLCGAIEVVPRLFDRVIIPAAVLNELQHANTPAAVREWVSSLPPWTEVRQATPCDLGVKMGAGEMEAITLALELKVAAILVDDDKARKCAIRKGLAAVGTLAILEKAAEQRLIDLPDVLTALRQTNIHLHPRLLQESLARHEQRLRAERQPENQSRSPEIEP